MLTDSNKAYSCERDAAIDVARGIALLLMVIGHLGIKKWPIQYIYAFHMPLFFMLSGMTIRKTSHFKDYFIKRIRRLLIPYILFAAIYSLPGAKYWALDLYGSRGSLYAAASLTPLWFLPALFVADVLFQIMLQICRKKVTTTRTDIYVYISVESAIFGALGVLLASYKIFNIGWPFGIEIALIAMPFIAIGWIIKEHFHSWGGVFRIIGMIVMLSISLFLYRFNLPPSVTEGFNHVEMSIGSCGNILLFYLNAVTGSVGVIMLASLICRAAFLRELGKCTLSCLVTHGFIISSVYGILNRVGIPLGVSSLIAFICVLVLIYPIQKILEGFAPNLIGKW